MSESVPLGPTLRVQVVDIIIRKVLEKNLDLMFEGLSIKGWLIGHVQWKTIKPLAPSLNK